MSEWKRVLRIRGGVYDVVFRDVLVNEQGDVLFKHYDHFQGADVDEDEQPIDLDGPDMFEELFTLCRDMVEDLRNAGINDNWNGTTGIGPDCKSQWLFGDAAINFSSVPLNEEDRENHKTRVENNLKGFMIDALLYFAQEVTRTSEDTDGFFLLCEAFLGYPVDWACKSEYRYDTRESGVYRLKAGYPYTYEKPEYKTRIEQKVREVEERYHRYRAPSQDKDTEKK